MANYPTRGRPRARATGGMKYMANRDPERFADLLDGIKIHVRDAHCKALKSGNQGLTPFYWEIGRMIAIRQRLDGWGISVIDRLAKDLQKEFPDVKGLSSSNLSGMKHMFEKYSSNEKLMQLVLEVGWSHNIIILKRCKDDLEREFYIRNVRKHAWPIKLLAQNIKNQFYQKTLVVQTNFERTLPPKQKTQASLAFRDEYRFDFVNLDDSHSERELELALVAKPDFLLAAIGGGGDWPS